MKTYKKLNYIYSVVLFVFVLLGGSVGFGQASSVQLPQLYSDFQTAKGPIRLIAYDSEYALTKQDDNSLDYQLISSSQQEQLWWVIQDVEKKAFALASATNPDKWLAYRKNPDRIELVDKDELTVSTEFGDIQSNAYFFTLEMYEGNLGMLIRSELDKGKYLKTNNRTGPTSEWNLTIESLPSSNILRDEFYFNSERYSNTSYTGIDFFNSNYHIEQIGADKTTITANGIISGNNQIVCSGKGVCVKKAGDEEMFRVKFNAGVIGAKIGLLHYSEALYDSTVYQGDGLRNPEAGIGKLGDTIYLFNKAIKYPTNFVSEIPIYFGYKKGILYAKQQGVVESLKGVNTETLLNSFFGNSSKLMIALENSSLEISVKSDVIFFTSDHDGLSEPYGYSTNPNLSYSESSIKPANQFDWRSQIYKLRYKVNGQDVVESVQSPFYENEMNFSAIAAKYDPLQNYIGGEDFNYYDGWELITMDFGYNANGSLKPSYKLRGEPYMVMYNRFIGKLRVFVYINNPSIANQLGISISDGPHSGVITQYQPARLWGSILQGKALNDSELVNSSYSKFVELSSSTTGKFIFADFILNHDPCITEFESNLRISVKKITSGSLEIVGRTLGGNIPANSPSIGNWLSSSNDYLMGVMNTPYGSLSNTMGDITFRDFERWGADDWSNEASFVLPGKKIQAWEKEIAKLRADGEKTMTSGDLLSGAGKVVKGFGKVAQIVNPPFVKPGKGMEAAGEFIDAAGTLLKGAGRGLKAKAAQLYYDNLKDTPDKTINVSLPNPQPSVVFSELAASGTVQIETTVFNDVIITTPGSKNSEFAPVDEYLNGSKGLFPFYNKELGLYNLLYKPDLAIALVRRGDDVGGFLKLKQRPYLSVNVHKSKGYTGGIFVGYYVVTTFDNNGNAIRSERSNPYLLSKHPSQTYRVLPSSIDITNLIDKQTIISNLDGSSNTDFSNWIEVEMEVEYFGFGLKAGNGKYGGVSASQSYMCSTSFNYDTSLDNSSSINLLAENAGNTTFPDYDGSDIELWGSNYIVYDALPNYSSLLNSYCNSILLDDLTDDYNTAKIMNEGEFQEIEDIKVYPNPSHGIFEVKYVVKGKGDIIISLLSSDGKEILSHRDNAYEDDEVKQVSINIENVSEGIYFLKVYFQNGEIYNQKLVKM